MTYEQQLNKILGTVFSRYRGISMERKDGYWICLGVPCENLKACDIVINDAANSLSNSLNKNTNHVKSKEESNPENA